MYIYIYILNAIMQYFTFKFIKNIIISQSFNDKYQEIRQLSLLYMIDIHTGVREALENPKTF